MTYEPVIISCKFDDTLSLLVKDADNNYPDAWIDMWISDYDGELDMEWGSQDEPLARDCTQEMWCSIWTACMEYVWNHDLVHQEDDESCKWVH